MIDEADDGVLFDLDGLCWIADATTPMEVFERYGTEMAKLQRMMNWGIGDIARQAARRWPDTWAQVFPEWMSPGLISRCKAVAEAYQPSDRNLQASWSTHRNHSNDPNRVAIVQGHVDAGHTSDEARATVSTPARREREQPGERWLLAVDVNYYVSRFYFAGQRVNAASGVAEWLHRLVTREATGLMALGLTDVVCCFDSDTNHRKALTEGWERPYKDREHKPVELVQQLAVAPDLMATYGYACVTIPGMEADDVMASYAAQFAGRVTLLTQDKDLRQCLSKNTNILADVWWDEGVCGPARVPKYTWLTAQQHIDEMSQKDADGNIIPGTGITPAQWPDYQAIMGDNTDHVRGAEGIGKKGAADLLREFGTLDRVVAAAKNDDERIKARHRAALVEFAKTADITKQLVTMRVDLDVPRHTRCIDRVPVASE